MTELPNPKARVVGPVAFVALKVGSVKRTIHFYKDLLKIPFHATEISNHYEVDWHDPYFHMAIFPRGRGKNTISRTKTWLGFSVKDLSSIHERLMAENVKVINAPKKEHWGLTADYEDPDGNVVALTELRMTH